MTDDRLTRLEPLVGSWNVTMSGADWIDEPIAGTASFEWILGGQFLLQKGSTDIPEAPDLWAVIGTDAQGDGYVQHYFDSRNVARVYAMSWDGMHWTLTREKPDFSPFGFSQRWSAELSGDTLAGTWFMAKDHENYEKDFDLTYTRVSG